MGQDYFLTTLKYLPTLMGLRTWKQRMKHAKDTERELQCGSWTAKWGMKTMKTPGTGCWKRAREKVKSSHSVAPSRSGAVFPTARLPAPSTTGRNFCPSGTTITSWEAPASWNKAMLEEMLGRLRLPVFVLLLLLLLLLRRSHFKQV